MNGESEKTRHTNSLTEPVLTVLALISVATVLCSAALTVAGVSWRLRAFFAVVSVLFDLVFVYELATKAVLGIRDSRFRRLNWSDLFLLVSSLPPFLLVSGPFLAGWLHADFAASAVRSYGISSPPLGALATVAALRLLRAARPFFSIKPRVADKPATVAASFGLLVVFIGAVFADGLVLPSWFSAWSSSHEATLLAIADLEPQPAARLISANPVIKAAVVNGITLKHADSGLMPADYVTISNGRATLWLDATPVHAARGVVELIAALAALMVAIVYGYVLQGRRTKVEACPHLSDPDQGVDLRTVPVGGEELKGILGKSYR